MGHFVSYTFIAGITMLAMWIMYRWMLSDEKQPGFNRIVLLSIYIVSFIIPRLTAVNINVTENSAGVVEIGEITTTIADTATDNITDNDSRAAEVILIIYLTGMAIAFCLTAATWIRLMRIISTGEKTKHGRFTVVVIDDNRYAPFSWLNYIVIARNDYNSYINMILTHETKHLELRHPIDMIICQLSIIIQWYNPAAYLMRDELRSVHEYQADEAVLKSGVNARSYQLLLIKKAVGKKFPALANSLNHSKLKKRITMMTKNQSSKSRRLRVASFVPAIAAALCVVNYAPVANALESIDQVEIVGKINKNMPDERKENEITIVNVGTVKKDSIQQTNPAVVVINHQKDATSGNNPLVIVDGKECDNMSSIAPEDIESISVIKDETAKKIYGDKAENGVIIITLKHEVSCSNTISAEHQTKEKTDEKVVFAVVEQAPEFPGGTPALMKYLTQNIKFPASEANKPNLNIRVIVKFIVSADGTVKDPAIMKSGGEAFDQEAIRVVKTLPKFTPGRMKNQPVDCDYTLPIAFKTMANKSEKVKK